MIKLHRVSKVYRKNGDDIRALDDVTLSVAQGESVVVRGPSGCGKSSLLLTIGGMVRPSAGRVEVDGEDIYARSVRWRARFRSEQIGFVFQMFHLVPYLNVEENVLLPLLSGTRHGSRRDAMALIERFGLGERLRHRPAELSIGERQRVALARALLNRPGIVLADEPTGNLDPENSAHVLERLAEYHADGGTVVLVSHDPVPGKHADRILAMRNGRIG